MSERQFDIPLSNQLFFVLPNDVKGKLSADDFVYFNYDEFNIHPHNYDIAVQSYSGQVLKFTQLGRRVQLPHVLYAQDTTLYVVPKTNRQLPTYIGTLKRGHSYTLNPIDKITNTTHPNLYLM